MCISKEIIQHVISTNYEKIPQDVIQVQKKALIDAIAVSLAASSLGEGCNEFISLAKDSETENGCIVLGCGFKSIPLMAALANGAMAHAMDFEDAHDASTMHSNAVSTAAALTVADMIGGVSGKEFLAAMVLGSDIAIRLALAMNEDVLKKGWYMPPIHGAMGAVLAVGKIMKLTEAQMLDAFTLTMNQVTCSGELVNSSQSVIRSVRDSFAAKSAVLSCLLAKKGLKARFDMPLEGKLGYYHAYGHGDYTPERITEGLSEIYESSKISFKPWPSCRGTHPYIDMMIHIMKENNISFDSIEKVHVVVSPLNEMLFNPPEVKYKPSSAINAKFSIPFTTGIAAKYGTVGLEHFTSEFFENKDIISLASKISFEVNHGCKKTEALHGRMTIVANGKEYSHEVKNPKGSIENPMTNEEFKQKFISCAKYARKPYSPMEAESIYNKLMIIEEINDMKEVIKLL